GRPTYTLSLHAALPISSTYVHGSVRDNAAGMPLPSVHSLRWPSVRARAKQFMILTVTLFLLTGIIGGFLAGLLGIGGGLVVVPRSEEHTSELQSRENLV